MRVSGGILNKRELLGGGIADVPENYIRAAISATLEIITIVHIGSSVDVDIVKRVLLRFALHGGRHIGIGFLFSFHHHCDAQDIWIVCTDLFMHLMCLSKQHKLFESRDIFLKPVIYVYTFIYFCKVTKQLK